MKSRLAAGETLVGAFANLGSALAVEAMGVTGLEWALVALDVFDPEPPDTAHPSFERDDVICSPHALALTAAAKRAVSAAMSDGMATVLDGGRAPHVANPAA